MIIVSNAFGDDNKGGAQITTETIRTVRAAFPGEEVALIPIRSRGDYALRDHRFTSEAVGGVLVLPPVVAPRRGPFGGLMMVAALCWRLIFGPGGNETLRALSSARLVVSKAGFVFVERKGRGGLFSLWVTAFPLLFASRCGVPTVVLCSSIGPFTGRASIMLNRFLLRRVSLVVARDRPSYDAAVALGCPNVRERPDIVFGVEEGHQGGDAAPVRTDGPTAVLHIARADGAERFLPRLAALGRRLVEDGTVRTLRISVQSEEDLALSEQLMRALELESGAVWRDDPSPAELMRRYRGAAILIGSRMHAGIFALAQGTPALTASTGGRKVAGVMRTLGLETTVIGYPEFDLDRAAATARFAVGAGRELRADILARVATARSALSDLGGALRAVAGGQSAPGPKLFDPPPTAEWPMADMQEFVPPTVAPAS